MRSLREKLKKPSAVRTLKSLCLAVLVILALAEILVVKVLHLGHGHFWFEDLPAFGSFYGLLSCALIVWVSKALGHAWLMKDEDYYD